MDLAFSNTGNSDYIERHAVKVHYKSATDDSRFKSAQGYRDVSNPPASFFSISYLPLAKCSDPNQCVKTDRRFIVGVKHIIS